MIAFPDSVRILLFAAPADMRCGFDGLMGLIARANEDPYSGHLFVFLSRTRERAKVITFQRGGFILWYKRLEKGRFRQLATTVPQLEIDSVSLSMLLDGIDVAKVVRPKHWQRCHGDVNAGDRQSGRSVI